MKKVCLVLVALVIFGGFFITTAEAGQLCWQMDSPSDPNLNGFVTVMASGGKWTRSLHGAWYVQGSWYWPVAGNMVKRPNTDTWFLQLHSAFLDSSIGIMGAFNVGTLSGAGRIMIIGAEVVAEDATFTSISCRSVPPYVAP